MSYNQINNKNNVEYLDVDKAIEGSIGNEINNTKLQLNYNNLNKYIWLFKNDLLEQKPLLKLSYQGNNDGLLYLKNDLMNMFNIGFEAILEIDLSGYKDSIMLTSLIGAPPGYVGYEDEGVLSKHILEYPMSIIVFKGYDKACGTIKSFVSNMLYKGEFIDQKGRCISLNYTILIIEGIKEKKNVGFSNSMVLKDNIFDEYIISTNKTNTLNEKYQNALKKLSYEISFDFDISINDKNKVNEYIYNLVNTKEKGSYVIKKEEIQQIS